MAFSYIKADRDQLFLMPVDMREWLPDDHLAWFVVDVVERLDTSALHRLHPNDGAGRPAYDPEALLALLIYGYCTGLRSSRKLEQACYVDIAYRVICANQPPDHTTIARFRQVADSFAQELFVQALSLCAQAGLAQVGLVAIDGTKMAADASPAATRSLAQVREEVAAMFAEAERTDAEEDGSSGKGKASTRLPAGLADRRSRQARLEVALAELQAMSDAQAARRSEAEARADAARAKAAEKGKVPRGRAPITREVAWAQAALERAKARSAKSSRPGEPLYLQRAQARLEKAKAREASPHPARSRPSLDGQAKVNLTDPEARTMRGRGEWVLGYNAQLAVNEAGVVLAAEVSQNAADSPQAVPMMNAMAENLAAAGAGTIVGTVLFDAGYCSEANITASGPARLIGTKKKAALDEQIAKEGFRRGPPPPGAGPVAAMEHMLCTQQGARLYARRSPMVEPIFGLHKHVRGYRRLSRRGLQAASAEWKLINTTHNLLKLFRSAKLAPAAM
jgi:transposase